MRGFREWRRFWHYTGRIDKIASVGADNRLQEREEGGNGKNERAVRIMKGRQASAILQRFSPPKQAFHDCKMVRPEGRGVKTAWCSWPLGEKKEGEVCLPIRILKMQDNEDIRHNNRVYISVKTQQRGLDRGKRMLIQQAITYKQGMKVWEVHRKILLN